MRRGRPCREPRSGPLDPRLASLERAGIRALIRDPRDGQADAVPAPAESAEPHELGRRADIADTDVALAAYASRSRWWCSLCWGEAAVALSATASSIAPHARRHDLRVVRLRGQRGGARARQAPRREVRRPGGVARDGAPPRPGR